MQHTRGWVSILQAGGNSRKPKRAKQSPLRCELLEDRRVLATFTVTSANDAGAGSLREAVGFANGAAGADTINFAAGLNGGTINLTSASLVITDSVAIDGPAARVTINGLGDVPTGFRIFKVDDGTAGLITVSMDDLNISGGSAKPEANTDDAQAAINNIGRGGGIDNRENLTLDRVTLTNNFARRGANLSVAGNGGDVTTLNAAVITIRNSVISNGRSDWLDSAGAKNGRAGGIAGVNGGTVNITNTTFENNYSNVVGGAMDLRSGTYVNISDSTIKNNTADLRSGAIYGQRGHLFADSVITLTRVTVTGNAQTAPDNLQFGALHTLAGSMTVTDCDITNNPNSAGIDVSQGGGAFATAPDPSVRVSIVNSRISGNQTGGVTTTLIAGVDFTTRQEGAVVEIRDSTINNNGFYAGNPFTGAGGGAYLLYTDSVRISNSTITGNAGQFAGGVALIFGEDDEISNSTISNNTSYYGGGGIYASATISRIIRSTISGNRTSTIDEGGGIAIISETAPGGLFPPSTNVTISQSTVSGNISPKGGGVYVYAPSGGMTTVTIDGSTITANTADNGSGGGLFAAANSSATPGTAAVTMTNTILARNTDTGTGADIFDDGETVVGRSPIVTGTFNFIGDNDDGTHSGFVEGNPGPGGNKVGGPGIGVLNPDLGSLSNNGGPTLTHKPNPGSPVINMGDPATAGGTDQTGAPRVQGGRVDMGSVEVGSGALNLDFNNDGQYNCDDMNLLETAIDAGMPVATFDVNGDGMLTSADVSAWLVDAGAIRFGAGRRFLPGDANLNGSVDGSDFGIWNANKFTPASRWCLGDFTQTGGVDGSDFGVWNANKFTSSDASRPVDTRNSAQRVTMAAPTAKLEKTVEGDSTPVNPAVQGDSSLQGARKVSFGNERLAKGSASSQQRAKDLVFAQLEAL